MPAGAVIINGTDYAVLSNKRIATTGPFTLVGAVGVNDPNGILDIGSGGRMFGLARAHTIFAGQGTLIDSCEFDIKTGLGVCTASSSPFVPITAWPPLAIAAPPACVGSRTVHCTSNGASVRVWRR